MLHKFQASRQALATTPPTHTARKMAVMYADAWDTFLADSKFNCSLHSSRNVVLPNTVNTPPIFLGYKRAEQRQCCNSYTYFYQTNEEYIIRHRSKQSSLNPL